MWWRDIDISINSVTPIILDTQLLTCMFALGLAAYSHSVHAPELMLRASLEYGQALHLTNAALRSPIEATKDSTLLAVMILSMFEAVTGNSELAVTAWTEHINGAAALLKLRGEEQFKTVAGQRMFLQVFHHLMLSCIHRSIPMPDHIVELMKSAECFIDSKNLAWRLGGVIIDFTIFRACLRDLTITDSREMVFKALELDRRFVDIFTNLSPRWQYKTVYTNATPHLIWNGSYHIYPELGANFWNSMRTCRVLLHEIICSRLLPFPSTPVLSIAEDLAQNEASESIMRTLRNDILGSIPDHTLTHLANNSNAQALHRERSKAYFVLWPLYVAGAMDVKIRTLVIQKLRYIGETVGLRQAVVIAQWLEKKKDFMIWETNILREVQGKGLHGRTPSISELATSFGGSRGNTSCTAVRENRQDLATAR